MGRVLCEEVPRFLLNSKRLYCCPLDFNFWQTCSSTPDNPEVRIRMIILHQ